MKLDIPELGIPRVVVVGGGFAGIELVKSLKNTPVQVVLVDKNNYHSFQPLLYQVAASGLGVDNIAYPIRKIFQSHQHFYFRIAEVLEILPSQNQLVTDRGILNFDYLVIATGSQTNFFGNEGLMVNAMPMKTIQQSLALRSMVLQNFERALTISNSRKKQSLLNFVIAGGGPTGVELAGAFGELKRYILPKDYPELDMESMHIYLIQSDDRLLPTFSKESSQVALEELQKLGVNVLLNTRVMDYQGDYVQTNLEQEIVARTLIWTAGVIGAPIKGLPATSITKGKRISVDALNKVLDTGNIYALGDVACMATPQNPAGDPMVAQVAIQQGKHLAQNLKRILANQAPKPFVYKDKGSMATIGKNKAVAEIGRFKIKGRLGWFLWLWVHLLFLVGFRNRILVLINWMSNYFTYDRGIRLIITPFNFSKVRKARREFLEEELRKNA